MRPRITPGTWPTIVTGSVMAPSQNSVLLSGPLLEKINNRPKTLTTMLRNEDTTTAASSTIDRCPCMRAITYAAGKAISSVITMATVETENESHSEETK